MNEYDARRGFVPAYVEDGIDQMIDLKDAYEILERERCTDSHRLLLPKRK